MIYYYKIDIKDNIFLTEHNVDEHSVFLSEFEVDFLRKVLENELLDSLLKRLDYLRGALEAEDGIEIKSYYVLVQALVTQSFQTFFKIAEPKYYVHVFPGYGGYLNVAPGNAFSLNDNEEWGVTKTKFTKEEVEELKKMPSLKGINFDECLEEVQEDED